MSRYCTFRVGKRSTWVHTFGVVGYVSARGMDTNIVSACDRRAFSDSEKRTRRVHKTSSEGDACTRDRDEEKKKRVEVIESSARVHAV